MSLVIVSVIATLIVLLFAARSRGKSCPHCSAQLPAVRKPSSLRQMLWGGWTCPSCHSEVDRSGKLIAR
jgi:hypothetical protein